MLNFIACNLSPTDESKLIGIDPITLDLHRSGTLICHLVWYTGHWMQTSSYVTSGRLFLSYPEQRNTRQFQETHFSRSSHELVRKSAINTPLHAVFFFFFVQPSFFAYNLVDLSEARFSENVVVPAETFGRISKSLDKFATIPVDSFVATAFSELSFYLSSVMLCREFLKSGANFFKENFSTSFVV